MKDHWTRTVCNSFSLVGPFDTASRSVTIQMKTTGHYFPVVLFITLYKVVLTFESVDEILWCDHSNETSSAVLSHGTIYLVCSSNFWVCGWNPMVWPFKWKLLSSTFLWYCLLCCTRWFWLLCLGMKPGVVTIQMKSIVQQGRDLGGACRGCAPSLPPWDDLRFSTTTGILPKKKNYVVYWRWSRARDECTPS